MKINAKIIFQTISLFRSNYHKENCTFKYFTSTLKVGTDRLNFSSRIQFQYSKLTNGRLLRQNSFFSRFSGFVLLASAGTTSLALENSLSTSTVLTGGVIFSTANSLNFFFRGFPDSYHSFQKIRGSSFIGITGASQYSSKRTSIGFLTLDVGSGAFFDAILLRS